MLADRLHDMVSIAFNVLEVLIISGLPCKKDCFICNAKYYA